MTRHMLLIALVGISLIGCTEHPERQGGTDLIDLGSVAGQSPCQRSPIVPVADGDQRHLQGTFFRRDLCIDGMQHELVHVDRVAIRHDGTIAVLQRQSDRILVFSPDGQSLLSIGREGGGPGEFKLAAEIGWEADTLWVFDSSLARLSRFLDDGSLIRTTDARPNAHFRNAPPSDPGYDYQVLSVRPDGSVLGWLFGRRGSSDPLLDGMSRVLVHLSHVEGPSAPIVGHIVAKLPLAQAIEIPLPGGSGRVRLPFPNDPVLAIEPGGARIAIVASEVSGSNAGSVALTILSADGDTLKLQQIALPGVPIPSQVADSVRDRFDSRAREHTDRAMAEATRRAAIIPDVYPPVVDAVFAEDGRIWFRGLPRQTGYSVFDLSSGRLATVELPPRATIFAADRSRIWTVERDQYDVPSIVRYTFVAEPEPPSVE